MDFLLVILIAVSLTLTTAAAQNGNNGKRGQDKGPKGCDLESLKNLGPEIKDGLSDLFGKGMPTGMPQVTVPKGKPNQKPSDGNMGRGAKDFLDQLGKLPEVCAKKIISMLKPGDCNVDNATDIICGEEGKSQSILAALRCVQQKDICTVLDVVTRRDDCLESRAKCAVGSHIFAKKCRISGIPEDALNCPESEKALKNIDKAKLQEILDELAGEDIHCKQVYLLKAAIEKHYKTIDEPAFIALRPVLPFLSKKVCDAIPVDLVKKQLVNLKDMKVDCRNPDKQEEDLQEEDDENEDDDGARGRPPPSRCIQHCIQLLVKKLLDENKIDANNSADIESLGNLKKCIPGDRALEMAQAGQCSAAASIARDQRKKMKIAKACRPKGKSAEQMTKEEVDNLGGSVFEQSDLEDWPKNLLCDPDVLSRLPEDKSPRLIKLLDRKCSDGKNKLGKDDLVEAAGGDRAVSSRKNIDKIDCSTLEDGEVAEIIKKAVKERKGPGKKAVVSEIAGKCPNMKLSALLKLGEEVLREKASRKLCQEIQNPESELAEAKLTETQERCAADKILKSKKAEDMTPDDFDKVKNKDVWRGFSANNIDKINPNYGIDIVKKMAKVKGWKGKQAEALKEKTREGLLERNAEDPFSTLTKDEVIGMDETVLAAFESEELKNTTKEVCVAICKKLGSFVKIHCHMHMKKKARVLQVCLECMDKDGSSAQLDAEDVEDISELLQADDGETANKMTNAAVKAKCRALRRGCPNKKVLEALMAKVKEALGSDPDSASFEECGWLSSAIDKATADRKQGEIAEAASAIAADMTDDEKEGMMCCHRDMKPEDSEALKGAHEGSEEVVRDAVVATSDAGTERRKKRAAPALSCADLKQMYNAVTKITKEEINMMSNAEFKLCLQHLGLYSDWPADTRTGLLNKAKTAVAPVCDMTSVNLEELGYISLSLSKADIECLKLDDNVVSVMGGVSGWTNEQLEALASKYLSVKTLTAAQLTGGHLSTMGHVICGLKMEDIKKIPVSVFKSRIASIGGLKKCRLSALQALRHLAVHNDGYGPVSNWSPSDFGDVGIILGGLTGDELKSAGEDDIEMWKEAGIEHIPAEKLKYLSKEQFESMDRTQAQVISDDQKSQLSVEQTNAINRALNKQDAEQNVPEDTSGVKTLTTSGVMMLTFCTLLWKMM